jgi:hypothetical protein
MALTAATAGVFVVLLGGSAVAATDATSTVLLAPAGTVEFRADWGGAVAWNSGSFTAKASVLVRAADMKEIEGKAYFATGQRVKDLKVSVGTSSVQTASLLVEFQVENDDPETGWLVLHRDTDDVDQVIDFTVTRVVGASVLSKPVIGAVLLPAILLLWKDRDLRHRFKKENASLIWKTPLRISDPKWSFTESWASNIAAVGAILGTVLASKDFVTDALSGLSIAGFVGLSLVFGLVALFAPVVFAALMYDGKGTYGGLMLAGYVTTCAIVGELLTLAILVHRGGMPQVLGLVVNFFAWGVLTVYLWRSIDDLVVPGTLPTAAEAPATRHSAIM